MSKNQTEYKPMLFAGKRTRKIAKWIKFTPMGEWFEENIKLLKGNVRGNFRIKTAPHLRVMFEALDRTEVQVVTLKSASQVQKTSFGLGALMKWIDTDYHDLFCMLPRANDIKKFLEFKITPMIQGTSSVKTKMEDYNQDEKTRKNSHFYKTAQNLLAIISANDTKSITAKYMLFDEASEFDASIIMEALERAKTYALSGYKALIVSTQIHVNDAINYFFDTSEVKMQYFMYCIHCKGHYYPEPQHIKYKSVDEYKKEHGIKPETKLTANEIQSDYKPYASKDPHLECPHCQGLMNDMERRNAILSDKLKWFQVTAVQVDDDDIVYQVAKKPKEEYSSVGFDINTLCIANVPLKTFVQKEIECEYASPHEKYSLYEKLYVGYYNKIYQKKSMEIVKKNDILLLDNGIRSGIIPKDHAGLHLGVDLQKNRLYYTVGSIQYGMKLNIIAHGELMSEDMGMDFIQLEDIIEMDFFDEDGEVHKIQSVGIDIRGFGAETPTGELISRRAEAWNFIQQYIEKLEDWGVTNADNFIYPTMGFDKLPKDEAYRETIRSYSKADEALEESSKRKLKVLDFSNIQIKARLFNMIERTIKKVNADIGDREAGYDRELFYINSDIVMDAEARKDLPMERRGDKHSFEAHMVSERLTYKIGKNGKPAPTQTYEKIYDGVRNDYLDCCCSIIVQAMHKKTANAVKPPPPQDDTSRVSRIADAF